MDKDIQDETENEAARATKGTTGRWGTGDDGEKGDKGDDGDQGLVGPLGPQAPAPALSRQPIHITVLLWAITTALIVGGIILQILPMALGQAGREAIRLVGFFKIRIADLLVASQLSPGRPVSPIREKYLIYC